jgi:hypothetical protein
MDNGQWTMDNIWIFNILSIVHCKLSIVHCKLSIVKNYGDKRFIKKSAQD